jgi:hypothetical protein
MPPLDYRGHTPVKKSLRPFNVFGWLSLITFAGSLALPAFYTDWNSARIPGVSLLLCGCLGLLVANVAWLANPALILSWILLRKADSPLAPLLFAVMALPCALSFLLQKKIMMDEAGHYGNIIGYGPGYWLWITSILLVIVASVVALRRDRQKSTNGPA